ncbi:hypothetical protein NQ318_020572 [Aromia moschata]|uniref:Thioredoxin-related transmembrane protein 1 n=1 Tax=Aromia moschata TaxID=1265417 RepID=A0AAV8Z326_9CUCU|nr:hypothetical protein NQ318_020572 [Aromia moschata]
MSVVSLFFKLSQALRLLHNKMTEEYGLPSVGSYLIFAIATIILGALLGLILVCAIDLIYPPKQCPRSQKSFENKGKYSEPELDDEDIKDDLIDDAAQSGGDHATGTESEGPAADTNGTKAKRRKNRRLDM